MDHQASQLLLQCSPWPSVEDMPEPDNPPKTHNSAHSRSTGPEAPVSRSTASGAFRRPLPNIRPLSLNKNLILAAILRAGMSRNTSLTVATPDLNSSLRLYRYH